MRISRRISLVILLAVAGGVALRAQPDLVARARAANLRGHETAAWDFVVLELWLASRSGPMPTRARSLAETRSAI